MTSRAWAGGRTAHRAEQVYVVFVLCCLTLGTVTWFWTNRLADPADVPTAVDWTFVLIQLPAVVMLVRRSNGQPLGVEWALAALVGWLILSAAWSAVPTVTLPTATSLLLTCCVGVYLSRSFTWTEITALTFVAMQPGLILSRVAIDRGWPGAGVPFSADGAAGIYGNRNSLGPPAVFGAACGVMLIAIVLSSRRAPWLRLAGAVGILAVVIFDVDLQRQGGSLTSWSMLAAFLATTVVLVLVMRVRRFSHRTDLGVIAGRAMLAAAAVAILIAFALDDQVSEAFDRPTGFSRRSEFWGANLDGVVDRPFVGWGWMAAWRADEFRAMLTPELSVGLFSHSAYFDIALGGGIVAVALAIVVAVKGTRSAGEALDRVDVASVMPLALVVAIAVGCTEESFFVGSYFLTALLVAGVCASASPHVRGT